MSDMTNSTKVVSRPPKHTALTHLTADDIRALAKTPEEIEQLEMALFDAQSFIEEEPKHLDSGEEPTSLTDEVIYRLGDMIVSMKPSRCQIENYKSWRDAKRIGKRLIQRIKLAEQTKCEPEKQEHYQCLICGGNPTSFPYKPGQSFNFNGNRNPKGKQANLQSEVTTLTAEVSVLREALQRLYTHVEYMTWGEDDYSVLKQAEEALNYKRGK